jgi:hypothetical protein
MAYVLEMHTHQLIQYMDLMVTDTLTGREKEIQYIYTKRNTYTFILFYSFMLAFISHWLSLVDRVIVSHPLLSLE